MNKTAEMQVRHGEIVRDWEKFQEENPNKHVFMRNVKKEQGEIVEFEILTVCDKVDRADWLKYYYNQSYRFECHGTTYEMPIGEGFFSKNYWTDKKFSNQVYLMDTITTAYRQKHSLTIDEFVELDKRVGVLGYICECSYHFDDMTTEQMIEDIEEYIEAQEA